ncbi:hypothetical protein SDJN03_25331, partial [Cucurbita argyrosperma subsp. sororia]
MRIEKAERGGMRNQSRTALSLPAISPPLPPFHSLSPHRVITEQRTVTTQIAYENSILKQVLLHKIQSPTCTVWNFIELDLLSVEACWQ